MKRTISEAQFQTKYNLYSQMLFNIAYTYFPSVDFANDCVQDAFMRYLDSSREFNTLDDEKYYIIRIVINVVKKNIKAKKAYVRLDDRQMALLSNSSDDSHKYEALFSCINLLDDKYKEVIILYYYEDMSVEDISKLLSLSSDNVRKRLERARNSLKEMEKKYGI